MAEASTGSSQPLNVYAIENPVDKTAALTYLSEMRDALLHRTASTSTEEHNRLNVQFSRAHRELFQLLSSGGASGTPYLKAGDFARTVLFPVPEGSLHSLILDGAMTPDASLNQEAGFLNERLEVGRLTFQEYPAQALQEDTLNTAQGKPVNLSQSQLSNINFYCIDFSHANLSHAQITQSSLVLCEFNETNVQQASLKKVSLQLCDLLQARHAYSIRWEDVREDEAVYNRADVHRVQWRNPSDASTLDVFPMVAHGASLKQLQADGFRGANVPQQKGSKMQYVVGYEVLPDARELSPETSAYRVNNTNWYLSKIFNSDPHDGTMPGLYVSPTPQSETSNTVLIPLGEDPENTWAVKVLPEDADAGSSAAEAELGPVYRVPAYQHRFKLKPGDTPLWIREAPPQYFIDLPEKEPFLFDFVGTSVPRVHE